MLPSNIDLTENRDFGGGETEDTLVSIYLDAELMTPEQYETVIRWERIFGKKRHTNEKNSLFDEETPFIDIWRNKCQRCGKELAPWNITYSLCRDCNRIVENNVQQIPWRTYRVTRINDRGQGDLFDLR